MLNFVIERFVTKMIINEIIPLFSKVYFFFQNLIFLYWVLTVLLLHKFPNYKVKHI